MLLFLIMLLGNKIKVIIKVSIGFCIGKILTFILLGSICFKFINKISSSWILIFLNVFFALIFLYLAILNLADYFNIKKNLGWKIRAQLPTKFRIFNNKVMKGFSEKILLASDLEQSLATTLYARFRSGLLFSGECPFEPIKSTYPFFTSLRIFFSMVFQYLPTKVAPVI